MQTDYPHTALIHLGLHGAPICFQRCNRSNLSQRGFTLLELLIVIALIGILAAIAVPNFQEMVKRNAVVSQNNELVALLNTAKSEAVRRSTAVRINVEGLDSGAWQAILLDPDTDQTLRSTANSRVILADIDQSLDSIEIIFNSRGYLGQSSSNPDDWYTGGITLRLRHINCTPGSIGQSREIQIRATGQIEGTPDDCKS